MHATDEAVFVIRHAREDMRVSARSAPFSNRPLRGTKYEGHHHS